MRDGIEYEFTVFLELDVQHTAFVGKDRTRLFDGTIFKPSLETGQQLLEWLDSGTDDLRIMRNPVSDEQKIELIDAINRAETREALFDAFAVAYRAATARSDTATLNELTKVKDARKAVLEARDEEALGAHS
jgi:hypothetical protein